MNVLGSMKGRGSIGSIDEFIVPCTENPEDCDGDEDKNLGSEEEQEPVQPQRKWWFLCLDLIGLLSIVLE
jgi:hypothetical protein